MERRKVRGFVRPPTQEEVRAIAESMYFHLSDEEASSLTAMSAVMMGFMDRVDELPQPRIEVKYPRTPGYRPTLEEDPLNLFITRCEVKGAAVGKAGGKASGPER